MPLILLVPWLDQNKCTSDRKRKCREEEEKDTEFPKREGRTLPEWLSVIVGKAIFELNNAISGASHNHCTEGYRSIWKLMSRDNSRLFSKFQQPSCRMWKPAITQCAQRGIKIIIERHSIFSIFFVSLVYFLSLYFGSWKNNVLEPEVPRKAILKLVFC